MQLRYRRFLSHEQTSNIRSALGGVVSLFNLPLLLDKSAIQSLTYTSIETLTRHYLLVLPPILLVEIMGDLHSNKGKITTPDSELNTRLVQGLAKKLITQSAVKNVDYRFLCAAELDGEKVSSHFRPCVAPTNLSITPDGGLGAFIDADREMKMIHNWQDANFTADEVQYAKAFKETSKEVDLNSYKERLKDFKLTFSSNSLTDLRQQISNNTLSSRGQWSFIGWYCDLLGLSPALKRESKRRFLASSATFQEFAPYTYHCYLVQTVFLWGLANSLISASKKGKAHIDIQYLFYLPHVRVFSSKDNLHRELWEAFGDKEQQVFIWADDLSADLNVLTSFWQSLSLEEKTAFCNFAPYPPAIENSPTFQAFEKMQKNGAMIPFDKFEGNRVRTRTEKEERAVIDRVLKTYRQLKGE